MAVDAFIVLGSIKIPFSRLGFNKSGRERERRGFQLGAFHYSGGFDSNSSFVPYLTARWNQVPDRLKTNDLFWKHDGIPPIGAWCRDQKDN